MLPLRRTALTALTALTAILAAAPLAAQAPQLRFTTTEKFDAKSIAPYAGTHADVYAHVDANLAAHLANLQRWLRQPSISSENRGIREMAEMLRGDLLRLGFREAELVPTKGHPGVWGFYDAGAPTTLAVYMMYDVQPVEPKDWRSPPFEAAVVDDPNGRAIMARGATNQKGPQRAFLNALESIIAVKGKLPVNLMVVAEGEEELGSPNFAEVVEKYADRLRTTSGVLFPMTSQSPSGAIDVVLGVKGIVYFEMEAKGTDAGGPKVAEVHGSMKALVDSPVWRLTQALASLTTPDGNTIRVPHYYDAIRPPSEEEQRLVNGLVESWNAEEEGFRKAVGVTRWIDGATGRDAIARHLFGTTLNIDGIWGGFTGPGVKTILPHKATAKLDSRLVPNQHPDSALRLIRAHLDAQGFRDVEVRKLNGYPPAQTSVDAPLVRAGIGAFNKRGLPVSVSPRLAGSAPYYLFTDRLKLPMLAAGLGLGAGAHAPNEFLVVEPKAGSKVAGLAEMEKFYVDLLFALAEVR